MSLLNFYNLETSAKLVKPSIILTAASHYECIFYVNHIVMILRWRDLYDTFAEKAA